MKLRSFSFFSPYTRKHRPRLLHLIPHILDTSPVDRTRVTLPLLSPTDDHGRAPPLATRPGQAAGSPSSTFSPRCNFISSSLVPSPARLPMFETLATATGDTATMAAMVALRPRTRRGDTFMALEDAGSATRDFDSAPFLAPSRPRHRRAPPVGAPVWCHGDRRRLNRRRRAHPGRCLLNRRRRRRAHLSRWRYRCSSTLCVPGTWTSPARCAASPGPPRGTGACSTPLSSHSSPCFAPACPSSYRCCCQPELAQGYGSDSLVLDGFLVPITFRTKF